MRQLKRFSWLALLLPQFAALVYGVYSDMRLLRYELTFHRTLAVGCLAEPFSFVMVCIELLGLAAVIGLCGPARWASWLYAVFALVVLSGIVPGIVGQPLLDPSILFLVAVLSVTLVLCGARLLRLTAPNQHAAAISPRAT